MARKKATPATDEQVLEKKEQSLTAIVAQSVFNITVQNAEQRLTKGGKQYDKVDLILAIDGNQPEYVISIVAYNKTIYSVTTYKFDGCEKLYFSPKSSISDTAAWLVTNAKIAPGMATELKKMLIAERRAALAKIAETRTE